MKHNYAIGLDKTVDLLRKHDYERGGNDAKNKLLSAISNDAFIDRHLDAVLKASGSALRHYSMQKSIDEMREAMRCAMSELLRQVEEGK